jgi:hypothetical protein
MVDVQMELLAIDPSADWSNAMAIFLSQLSLYY